jgi:NitT/TauT family transport system substrate-binding protein
MRHLPCPRRLLVGAVIIGFAAFSGIGSAHALDKVKAGKAVPIAWAFIPLDVGVAAGIWQKFGIDLEISSFAGDAKLQQALASDSIDFGLGSGPSMAFVVKGAPEIAVAAFAGEPRNIAVVVAENSPIKSVKDLKAKLIAVTTAGSLTEWLAKRMAIAEGWGPNGVRTIGLGSLESFIAAMKTDQIDAMMIAVEAGYALEEKKVARILVNMAPYAPHFHTHVVFAREQLVKDDPALVERFLEGFFASIAYMKSHREKTIETSMQVLNQSRAAMTKTYDDEISMLSDDGRFDPQALEVLKDSYVGMGILTTRPTDTEFLTRQFVPVKP